METLTDKAPMVISPYQTTINGKIRCGICPRACTLNEGGIGVCGGRQVIDGSLIAVNYAQISSLQLDPIEKKPLYHFYPGSDILSVGPNGCNLSCEWCQNWQISQNTSPTRTVLPVEIADMVDALDGIGAAYTYAEPLVWFEYLRDVGNILHDRGLLNVVVSNGYINAEPLKEILQVADAFNIDLKSNDDKCYHKHCGGHLEDVRRTIRMVFDAGRHLELTHLVVTGVNDDLRKIEGIVNWIAAVDKSIPLHLTRYYPNNHYDEPPTSTPFLNEAFELAKSVLDWVYLGNVVSTQGQDSICPGCGDMLVKRAGLTIDPDGLNGNRCRGCGMELYFRAAA